MHRPLTSIYELCVDDAMVPKGSGFLKFNSSLINDPAYNIGITDLISDFFDTNSFYNIQLEWELLKYEIKKFSIEYSKKTVKQKRLHKETLEKNLDSLKNANVDPENDEYKTTLEALEKRYHDIAIGIRIRSTCNWYELGEKSNKYFLNLEKRNAKASTITKLTDNDKVVTNHKEVLTDIEKYYTNLFTNNNKNTNTTCRSFLEILETPRLTEEDQIALSDHITINELHNTLLQMADEKSPGNDGLTCEFYKHFWEQIKQPYYD